jgi:hypothetical protein
MSADKQNIDPVGQIFVLIRAVPCVWVVKLKILNNIPKTKITMLRLGLFSLLAICSWPVWSTGRCIG